MKIRSQDCNSYLDFGEVYVQPYQGRAALYVLSRYRSKPVLAGVFEDMARARGVAYEIAWAYEHRQPVFYIPPQNNSCQKSIKGVG